MTTAARIRELLASGMQPAQIASELGCSRQEVSREKLRATPPKRTGRPRKARCPHCGAVLKPA